MGRPAASQARRPGVPACSPDWLTQPQITSSTLAGIDLVAFHQLLQHLRQQIHGVQLGQRAIGLGPGHGAADGIDDDGIFHVHSMCFLKLMIH